MATIVMKSAKVIEACEKTIALIMDMRTKDHAQKISEYLSYTTFSFLKMKRIPEFTLEQATAGADEYIKMFPYAWGDLSKAKNLLRLAQLGDPVTLNEEDCRVIF